MTPGSWSALAKGSSSSTATRTAARGRSRGRFLSGWEVFHAIKHDGSIFAAANHGVYGATVQRSDDGGKTWERSEGLGLPEDHELTLEKTWHVEPGANGSAVARRRTGRPVPLGRPRRELGARAEPDRPSNPRALEPGRRRDVHATRSSSTRPTEQTIYVGDLRRRRLPQRRRRRDLDAREQGHGGRLHAGRPVPRGRPVRPQGAAPPRARPSGSGSRTTAGSTARTTGARTGSGSRTTAFRAASAFRSRSITASRTWRS